MWRKFEEAFLTTPQDGAIEVTDDKIYVTIFNVRKEVDIPAMMNKLDDYELVLLLNLLKVKWKR